MLLSKNSVSSLTQACRDWSKLNHISTTTKEIKLKNMYNVYIWNTLRNISLILSLQHNYGAYAKWVSSDFDPTSTGYQKSEALINDAYANGRIDKDKALRIYYTSMEGEALFFSSITG